MHVKESSKRWSGEEEKSKKTTTVTQMLKTLTFTKHKKANKPLTKVGELFDSETIHSTNLAFMEEGEN